MFRRVITAPLVVVRARTSFLAQGAALLKGVATGGATMLLPLALQAKQLKQKDTELRRFTDLQEINADIATNIYQLLLQPYAPKLPVPAINRDCDLLRLVAPGAGGFYGPNTGKTIGVQQALTKRPGVIYWSFRGSPLTGLIEALHCEHKVVTELELETLLKIFVQQSRTYHETTKAPVALILDDIQDCPTATLQIILNMLHTPHREGSVWLIFLLPDSSAYNKIWAVSGYSTLSLRPYPSVPTKESLVQQLYKYNASVTVDEWRTIVEMAHGQIGVLMQALLLPDANAMRDMLDAHVWPWLVVQDWMGYHPEKACINEVVQLARNGVASAELRKRASPALIKELIAAKVLTVQYGKEVTYHLYYPSLPMALGL
eukprot:TRINITY_DN3776_c1_g1_i2.p1 TRINITY_DN3776_c1_g1~~TRINITY_DN3776_c1_g1_i2.p1  ORF type:complete len:374 (+),score=61.80 TRINITY_DN3776_c1_g1_i2:24-1145(+)